jgi:hypothetical protein
MGKSGGIYATLRFPRNSNMAWSVAYVLRPCSRSEGLLPSRRKHTFAFTTTRSTCYLQYRLLAPSANPRHPALMRERIRGKPKRGSPWQPTQPSLSPSTSPITGSSTHPPTLSPSVTPTPAKTKRRKSSNSSTPRQPSLPRAMATIPSGSPITPRSPIDPRLQFYASMSFPASASTWRSEPRTTGAAKRLWLHPPTHLDRDSFKERLGVLYDLVFELRREVADLKFRFQATEDNVETFLQILATMQGGFYADPANNAPGGEADTGSDKPLCQVSAGQTVEEHRNSPENAEQEKNKEQAEDEHPNKAMTEAWAADLGAAWLGFSPGV